MKKSRFTDPQIIAILRQAESGMPVPDFCREYGISTAAFYKWRAKFGGLDASMMAEDAVTQKGVSIALACRVFGVNGRVLPSMGTCATLIMITQ